MPKTNAEMCRQYRRKKNENKIKIKKKPGKSSTERSREFRARKKHLLNNQNRCSNISDNVTDVINGHYTSLHLRNFIPSADFCALPGLNLDRMLITNHLVQMMTTAPVDPLDNMNSPEYENYYDNKFHILEELKMEIPDKEAPHSDCYANNEIGSKDKELSKFNDQNQIKHEAMQNELPLNVTIKTERIVEGETLDNNKNISIPYKFTVEDVQLNSDERLLKNNVNLIKPNNEQTNMPRVAELNELHKCNLCAIYFDHHDDMLIHISLVHNEKMFKCELCGKQLNNVSNLKRHITLLHKHNES